MSEQDESSKTEDPTSRRLQEGRDKGQVAISQEVKNFAVLSAAALLLIFLTDSVSRDITDLGRFVLESAHELAVTEDSVDDALIDLLIRLGLGLAPIFAVFLVTGVASGWLQSGMIWSSHKLDFNLDKVSPISGFKRLVSTRTLVEFVKGLVKIAIVGAIAVMVSVPLLVDVERLVDMPVAAITERLEVEAIHLTAATAAVMLVIAVADYAYQKWAFLKEMRMTKQEVRDENRQQDGDPHIKARIRRLRTERAQRRMMAAVPDADVVITNPTHVAVALAYDMATMAAPRCVAKGADEIARRIREVAEAHAVPVLENPPLARALYAGVELDEEIPPEHYHAVAEIIGYVMRLKGRLP